MERNLGEHGEFHRYEYLEMEIRKHMKWLYVDYFPSFGWELNEIMPSEQGRSSFVHLSFKRKYEVKNKVELTRLQLQFESCIEEIRNLEISRVFGASFASASMGILGLVFFVAALYCTMTYNLFGSLLFIPSIAAWLMAFPCYRLIRNRKKKILQPVIEEKYDKLYEVCKRAGKLQ